MTETLHDSKTRLLDAAVAVIRAKGYAAMRIDDVCAAAGLTKGSFFHHFKSKEELALAAADRFAAKADALFAGAPDCAADDPLARLLAYVDFRKAGAQGELAAFTCLLGMMAQETYQTHPQIAQACGDHIEAHASTLLPDIAAAKAARAPDAAWSPESLALFTQAVVHGAFVLAKGKHDPQIAADCIGHLDRYLRLLFGAPGRDET
jgi:TetR/AcrR family transcriptional regulator, transcriptional repressor for nem operon